MQHIITVFGLYKIQYYSYEIKGIEFVHAHTLEIILGVFVCLFLLTLRKHKYTFLDVSMTDQIRGLAILSIIFYHYVTKIFNPDFAAFHTVAVFEPIGVSAFLILSGFGLMRSYLEKGIEKGYLIRRLSRVLLPYWVVTLVWIVLDAILGTPDTVTRIVHGMSGIIAYMNYTQDIDTIMWFVTYIVFWYIVFFVIMQMQVSNRIKIAAIFLMALVITLINGQLGNTQYSFIPYWQGYSLFFPVGILLGYLYPAIKTAYDTIPSFERSFILLVLFAISYWYGLGNSWVFGFVLLFPVMFLASIQLHAKFLSFFGSISYELYLIHGALMVKYDFFLYRHPPALFFFIYFTMCIALAYLLHVLITKKLYNRLQVIWNR